MPPITMDLLAWDKEGIEEQVEGRKCLGSAVKSAN